MRLPLKLLLSTTTVNRRTRAKIVTVFNISLIFAIIQMIVHVMFVWMEIKLLFKLKKKCKVKMDAK